MIHLFFLAMASSLSPNASSLDLSNIPHEFGDTRYDGKCWETPVHLTDRGRTIIIRKCEGWKNAVVIQSN